MPVYRIDRDGQDPRVVEAKTPAAARAHVAKDEIRTTKISAAEAMRLAQAGGKLETVGEVESEALQQSLARGSMSRDDEPDPDRQREDKIERDRLDAENPIGDE